MYASDVTSAPFRLFTPEQLHDFSRTTADRALDLLNSGDTDGARTVCRNASRNEHEPIRDVYMMWSAQTQSYVYNRLGLEALRNLLLQSVLPWLQPIAEQFRNGVTREAIGGLARLIQTECTEPPAVSEDDAVISFDITGWGDHRLVQAGCYGSDHAVPLAIVTEADPLTGGVAGTNIYRAVSFAAERVMVDQLGYPAFVLDTDGSRTDRLTIFKDPAAIADRYYERVGAQRDAVKMAAACSVAGGRLFDDTELAELGLTCLERAAAAIEQGAFKRAEGLCRLAKYEWYPGHHLLRDWMTAQLSWIDANHPGIMLDYFEYAYERSTLAPMQDAVKTMDLRDVVPWFATVFRQHAMSFHVEEDDDKITLATHPCGSGGRLIAEGAYESRPGLNRIGEASAATFGLDNFPSYCLHCPITNRTLFEGDGPLYQIVDPDIRNGRLNGHCKFYLYKRRQAVPAALYCQVGMEAPADRGEYGEHASAIDERQARQ